jgi:cell division ATPase FtsA
MSPTKRYSIEDAFNTIIDEIKAAVLEEVLAEVGAGNEEEAEKPRPRKAAGAVKKVAPKRHAPVEEEEDEEEEDDEEEVEDENEEAEDSEYWTEDELQEKSLGELKKIARETAVKIKRGADKDAIIEALLG